MKHTQPGFGGLAAGYLLLAIGIIFQIVTLFDTVSNFKTNSISALCIWSGVITVLAMHHKQQHAQKPDNTQL